MPTAKAVFQVLSGTDVVFNEDVDGALLSVFERMETYMTARNSEAEIEEGYSESQFLILIKGRSEKHWLMLSVTEIIQCLDV